MNFIGDLFEFSLDLQRAIIRYQEIQKICISSGCACPTCGHIGIAQEALAGVVLFHAGLSTGFFEAPLPESRPLPTKRVREPKSGFVYVMRNRRNGLFKIGFSINPRYRETTLQSEEPEVELVTSHRGTLENEKEFHLLFSEKRVRGEWFKLELADIDSIKKWGSR